MVPSARTRCASPTPLVRPPCLLVMVVSWSWTDESTPHGKKRGSFRMLASACVSNLRMAGSSVAIAKTEVSGATPMTVSGTTATEMPNCTDFLGTYGRAGGGGAFLAWYASYVSFAFSATAAGLRMFLLVNSLAASSTVIFPLLMASPRHACTRLG